MLIATVLVIIQDVPTEDIFKLSAFAVASDFCEWIQVGNGVYILIVSIMLSLTHLNGFPLLALLPYFTEITFFLCTNRINLLNLKESSGRLVFIAKGFLKLPNLHMLIKQESISSQKLGCQDFW